MQAIYLRTDRKEQIRLNITLKKGNNKKKIYIYTSEIWKEMSSAAREGSAVLVCLIYIRKGKIRLNVNIKRG